MGKSRDTSRSGGSAGVLREADINRRQSGLVVRLLRRGFAVSLGLVMARFDDPCRTRTVSGD